MEEKNNNSAKNKVNIKLALLSVALVIALIVIFILVFGEKLVKHYKPVEQNIVQSIIAAGNDSVIFADAYDDNVSKEIKSDLDKEYQNHAPVKTDAVNKKTKKTDTKKKVPAKSAVSKTEKKKAKPHSAPAESEKIQKNNNRFTVIIIDECSSPEEPLITKENAPEEIKKLKIKAEYALSMGNKEDALKYYEIAHKYSMTREFEYPVALLSIQLGQLDKAIEVMKKSSLDETMLVNLFVEMDGCGHSDVSIKTARDMLARDSKGSIYYYIARYYESNGKYNEASGNYKRAMSKSSFDPYITYSYANLQDKIGNKNEAIAYYRLVSSSDEMLSQKCSKRIEALLVSDK